MQNTGLARQVCPVDYFGEAQPAQQHEQHFSPAAAAGE
jgi:hypothetical protein